MKTHLKILFLSTIVCLISCTQAAKSANDTGSSPTAKKPNIIYILADDMGVRDLSCYGQDMFHTPNIDKLAAAGMMFTQHYSGSAVCAPSRSSLITGQHTGHTPIRGNKELKDREGQTPMPAESFTIGEMLKEAGYVTGAFGKWGLGFVGSEGDPNNQGFDEFYGYNCQRMAHRYYPPYLWKNQAKDLLAGNDWTNKTTYAPDRIHEEALSFIENNKKNPFFLYYPLVQPHAELIVPQDSIWDKFEGQFEEAKVFKESHPYSSDYGSPDFEYHHYVPQDKPHAVYAAMIKRIDVYVGQVMDKLEEQGLLENTLVIFTSDNGPATEGGADPEFFDNNGELRGYKRDLYEGGIRAPFIASWPGKIKKSSHSDLPSSFWDMMATFADLVQIETPENTDGVSILPTLLGRQSEQIDHEFMYWEFPIKGGRKAVRKGDWKGVVYNMKKSGYDNFELYNLKEDESESKNIADQYPDIVADLKQIMMDESVPSELFPFEINN